MPALRAWLTSAGTSSAVPLPLSVTISRWRSPPAPWLVKLAMLEMSTSSSLIVDWVVVPRAARSLSHWLRCALPSVACGVTRVALLDGVEPLPAKRSRPSLALLGSACPSLCAASFSALKRDPPLGKPMLAVVSMATITSGWWAPTRIPPGMAMLRPAARTSAL